MTAHSEYRDNEPFITPKIKCPECGYDLDLEEGGKYSYWDCFMCLKEYRAYKSPDGWELGEEI